MSSEETKVAVMQEQITYISKQVDTILSRLDENVKTHEKRMDRFQTEIDTRFTGVHTRIDTKADKEDLEKINSIISRINWFIILAVLGALLGLVITNT